MVRSESDLPVNSVIQSSVQGMLFGSQSLVYKVLNMWTFLTSLICYHFIVSPVIIKEWAAYKGKSPQTPELVEALAFREWTCPNLKKLWLGKAVEDKNRRMRAFLACMRSDTPAMLNPTNVPTHLMVLCCVLRSVLPEGKTEWNKIFTVRVNLCDKFNTCNFGRRILFHF